VVHLLAGCFGSGLILTKTKPLCTFRTKTAKKVEKVDTFNLAIGNHQTLTVVVAFMKFVICTSPVWSKPLSPSAAQESHDVLLEACKTRQNMDIFPQIIN